MAYTNKLNPVEQAKESAMWGQCAISSAGSDRTVVGAGKEIPTLIQRLFDVVNYLQNQAGELQGVLESVTRPNYQVECPKGTPVVAQTELGLALDGLASRLELLSAATDVLIERLQV